MSKEMEIPNVNNKDAVTEESTDEIYHIFGMKLRVVKEQHDGSGGTRFSCIHCALSNLCFKCQDDFNMGDKFKPCADIDGSDFRHFEKVEG